MDNSSRMNKRQMLDDSSDSKDESFIYETLKNKDPSMENLKKIMKALQDNQSLRMKMEKDIGLTMLHVACRMKETSLVEDLLNNGANVNAQIRTNSSIWPGCTPLYICMTSFCSVASDRDDAFGVYDILRLLLNREANVTLANKKQRTPVHVAYQHYISNLYYVGVDKPKFERLIMLLRAQKDFTVNPTSMEGITHFHIACSLPDLSTAENFLKSGKININQPMRSNVDYTRGFKHFPGAGCTPLHLAVMRKSKFVELSAQLETIDLLLKHNADVNAKKAWGETPFHVAILSEVREKLVSGGADVNAENAKGYTPLEDLLNKRPRSIDEILELLRWGCLYNDFNSETEIGLIGLSGRSLTSAAMQKLISTVMIEFPGLIKTDNRHRTPIHNLVSVYQMNFSAVKYTLLIEQLATTGLDIDDQDDRGKTALHMAVKFKNLRAITGLLMAGADINVTDVNGRTAFSQPFQPCPGCSQPTDAEDEQCVHFRVFKCLALQVRKLQLCGLDVHPENMNEVETAFPNFRRVNVNELFINELEEMGDVKIESLSLPVCRFLSEIDVVSDYPTMSEVKKNAIDEFFQLGKKSNQLREKYSEISGLLKLQYRKAVKRTKLIQKANTSLINLLANFRVPEVCSRIIGRFLSNAELQAVITAAEDLKIT